MARGRDDGFPDSDVAARLPTVVFVTGAFRSGSTLLSNLLGELDGYVCVGEMLSIWRNGLGGGLCGCGQPVEQCGFWTEVRAQAFDGAEPTRAEIVAIEDAHLRNRPQELLRLFRSTRATRPLAAPLRKFVSAALKLYASVRQTTGAEVVVDSSKSPAFALLLSTVSALDISFVHLVRDPRGVAYSWSRQKHSPDFPRHLDRQGPLTTAMKWVTWNAAAEALITTRPGRRSMRVRYEDFVSRPEGTLRAITKLVGTERDDLPLIDSSTARLGPAHTIGGNPIRFSAGTVKFSPDEEWQSRMSRSAWLRATGPALPLLLRYGYRVTSPARHVQGAT